MNVAPRRTKTLDAFLVWEAKQPDRCEFDGLQPVAMNDGAVVHAVIGSNLIAELTTRLSGRNAGHTVLAWKFSPPALCAIWGPL